MQRMSIEFSLRAVRFWILDIPLRYFLNLAKLLSHVFSDLLSVLFFCSVLSKSSHPEIPYKKADLKTLGNICSKKSACIEHLCTADSVAPCVLLFLLVSPVSHNLFLFFFHVVFLFPIFHFPIKFILNQSFPKTEWDA